jgi:hypothetical protein
MASVQQKKNVVTGISFPRTKWAVPIFFTMMLYITLLKLESVSSGHTKINVKVTYFKSQLYVLIQGHYFNWRSTSYRLVSHINGAHSADRTGGGVAAGSDKIHVQLLEGSPCTTFSVDQENFRVVGLNEDFILRLFVASIFFFTY